MKTKKIEKLEIKDEAREWKTQESANTLTLANKINEIIDYLNENKKENN